MDGKRQLAFAIVKHLKNEVSSGGHDDDTSESLEGIVFWPAVLWLCFLALRLPSMERKRRAPDMSGAQSNNWCTNWCTK